MTPENALRIFVRAKMMFSGRNTLIKIMKLINVREAQLRAISEIVLS